MFRQRFIRESRAAAAVDDPYIIPVFEAGEASGVLFIASRFVGGGNVRSLVARYGPLPPSRAAEIISQVASALDAAHARGLVHRDVKPANILLDASSGAGRPDHVYLCDFGLSKGSLQASGLTGTGIFLGTLDYIAPEQIEGKLVDGRADQYALACTAFEMLTGTPPFPRQEAVAVMYAQLSETPPTLSALPARAAAERGPGLRPGAREGAGAIGTAAAGRSPRRCERLSGCGRSTPVQVPSGASPDGRETGSGRRLGRGSSLRRARRVRGGAGQPGCGSRRRTGPRPAIAGCQGLPGRAVIPVLAGRSGLAATRRRASTWPARPRWISRAPAVPTIRARRASTRPCSQEASYRPRRVLRRCRAGKVDYPGAGRLPGAGPVRVGTGEGRLSRGRAGPPQGPVPRRCGRPGLAGQRLAGRAATTPGSGLAPAPATLDTPSPTSSRRRRAVLAMVAAAAVVIVRRRGRIRAGERQVRRR